MKFKRLISRVVATVLLACLIFTAFGECIMAGETWGFNAGVNPYGKKINWVKKNYTGDYGIWENILEYTQTGGQEALYTRGYGKYTGSIAIGYNSFRHSNTGSDRQLYSHMVKMKKVGSKTFKDCFKKGGEYYKGIKNSGWDKEDASSQVTPSNAKLYSPLNMLRLMQMYGLTRSGDSKVFIGGWPVQIVHNKGNYSYKLEGARTIKTVYQVFTGKSYDASKSKKKAEKGTNCTEESICYRLMNGTITMNKALKELKKGVKNANITLYSGSSLFTAGNMTYEEYLSRCLNSEAATKANCDQTLLAWSTQFNSYFNGLSNVKISTKKKELFYVCVFRYLQEYGISFNTAAQGNATDSDEIKTIFKGTGEEPYPMFNGDSIKNMKSGTDDENGISTAIKKRLKKYTNSSGNEYALGSSNTKPRMQDIATDVIDSMKQATGASSNDEAMEILSQYMTYTEGTLLGDAIAAIEVTKENKQTSADVNNKNKSTTSGFDSLLKLNDAYVVKFFLNFSVNGGNTDDSIVNNEYEKIISILDRKSVKNGKPTMKECYTMLRSMEQIKARGKQTYCYTFKAQNSSQLASVLQYCSSHLKRTKKYFSTVKTNYDNDDITFGKSSAENPVQMYSDWCEAYTTIKVMGGKAYGRAYPDKNSANNYDDFWEKYQAWKKNLKTGKTKYVDGVQHQDGFIPYGLEKDTSDLQEGTEKFFKDKNNSLEGKNAIKDSDSKTSKQTKILKWGVDVEEANKDLKENFWISLLNSVLAIIGILMMFLGFMIACFYAFDHISSNAYGITRKATLKMIEYSFDKKERRNTLFKFLVFVFLAALMYDGTLIRWGLYIMQVAYQSMTTK